MIYDALGIGFQVFRDGAMREIQIFRPGTAKNIWKFSRVARREWRLALAGFQPKPQSAVG